MTSSSQKRSTVVGLPLDLILHEVLTRVEDPKTLARLRCLCKAASSWISRRNTTFLQLYLSKGRLEKKPGLFLLSQSLHHLHAYHVGVELDATGMSLQWHKKEKLFSDVHGFPPVSHRSNYKCGGYSWSYFSVKNMLCLALPDGERRPLPGTKRFDIFDVATKKLITLPDGLASPYIFCCQAVGFGCTPSSNEYKVASFYKYSEPDDYPILKPGCEVFTVGTDQWRRVEDPPFYLPRAADPPFVEGAIHCLRDMERVLIENFDRRQMIASFDIESEKFRTTLPPPPSCLTCHPFYLSRSWKRLTEFQGRLCMVDFQSSYRFHGSDHDWAYNDNWTTVRPHSVDLWILQQHENVNDDNYSTLWTKQYTLGLSTLECYRFGDFIFPRAIDGEKILMDVNGGVLVYYDPNSDSFTEMTVEVDGELSNSIFLDPQSLLPLQL